ncbi:biopolymer transport protein ExbD [Monaibacterium marinum]|uniref:Biopolymer transport protein ExbD n=1 Tax=Pontivivens marinum TaxID=1690039 RepID=A0A2C9CRH4_9RHOB|nr:biopolymer transporter ExbD [Monaibacterium marinum]SOH93803.1 biopolymer transport protein ExbD [Monaibacterium marinum]
MTSLIDVIFLLLLFFMLSSTFSKFSEIPLFGAQAGTTAPASDSTAPLFVRLFEDRLQLNGHEFDLTTLADGVNQMRGDGTQSVLIAPQRDQATAQRLVDALVVLSTVPDLSVIVLE